MIWFESRYMDDEGIELEELIFHATHVAAAVERVRQVMEHTGATVAAWRVNNHGTVWRWIGKTDVERARLHGALRTMHKELDDAYSRLLDLLIESDIVHEDARTSIADNFDAALHVLGRLTRSLK